VKIRTNRAYMLSLESVAMTDIVMNLFIFFFISFSILYTFNPSRAKQIKVNLPKAKHVASAEKDAQDVATVALTSEGPMYLNGDMVGLKDLEGKLGEMRTTNRELAVLIQVDRLVAFKNVVRVLDVLNGLDIRNLRIAAEEEKK
jgi:biopolymer transport protein ExbD